MRLAGPKQPKEHKRDPVAYPNPVLALNEWGGFKSIKVQEPSPGLVGFLRVILTMVQFSPSKPQLPDGQSKVIRWLENGVSRMDCTYPSVGS